MSAAVRAIAAAETRPLRQRVLRPHQRIEELAWPGDDAPDTLHVGAVDESGAIVGIASVYREARRGTIAEGEWRLRGMATLPERRREGLGRALVDACIMHARARGGRVLWCDARTSAAAFYEALGFAREGEEFDKPGVGPHWVMWRPIDAIE